MKSSPSDTKFELLANRLGQWALGQNLSSTDSNVVIEVIEALRGAEDALFAAGFLASTLAEPKNLRFAWESGQEEFDAETALRQLKTPADYLMWAVDTELYGPGSKIQPPKAPPSRFYYTVETNGAKLKFDSPVPLGIDDACKLAFQQFARVEMPLDKTMRLSQCDENYVARDSVTVQTTEQLAKAGMLGGKDMN